MPGASRYRLSRGGQVVQETDGLSRYVSGIDGSARFPYTLAALDSSGTALRSVTFTVVPRGSDRIVAGDVSAPTNPTTGPIRTGSTDLGGEFPVRLAVYDAQSFELSWQRVPGASRYRLSRGGQVVQETDGSSRYVSGIDGSARFTYALDALDRSGTALRSTTFTVRPRAATQIVAGGGDTTPTNPNPAPTGSRPEIAARSVSITLYSSTAAELFWIPQGGTRPVSTRNEIRRDGVLIGTTPGEFARSYFDDTREPGVRYTYEIRTVSSSGDGRTTFREPDAARPPVQQRPDPVATGLPADLRAKLAVEFEVLNGAAIEKVVAIALRLNDPVAAGLRSIGSDTIDGEPRVVRTIYNCPVTGQLIYFRYEQGVFGYTIARFEAVDCGVGPIVVNGNFDLSDTLAEPGERVLSAFGVEIDDSRDLSTISLNNGSLYLPTSGVSRNGWRIVDLRVERPERPYSVASILGSGADERNALPDGSLGLTVEAQGVIGALGAGSDGGGTTLRTRGPFEFGNGRGQGRPTVGRLSVSADGDDYLIDAFNGDPASFLFVANVGGSTTGYTVPWSATFRLDAPSPAGVNVGF